jgi:hypothetical protein
MHRLYMLCVCMDTKDDVSVNGSAYIGRECLQRVCARVCNQ